MSTSGLGRGGEERSEGGKSLSTAIIEPSGHMQKSISLILHIKSNRPFTYRASIVRPLINWRIINLNYVRARQCPTTRALHFRRPLMRPSRHLSEVPGSDPVQKKCLNACQWELEWVLKINNITRLLPSNRWGWLQRANRLGSSSRKVMAPCALAPVGIGTKSHHPGRFLWF